MGFYETGVLRKRLSKCLLMANRNRTGAVFSIRFTDSISWVVRLD